ncbi:MAG: HIT family protein [Pyrobaculum sp.]|jgi:ATP adenylyltransferase
MFLTVDVATEQFNGGHVVIKLEKSLFELNFKELAYIKNLIDRIILIEKNVLKPEGFNIYISEKEISIIPRWCGDINVAFFGGLKIVPMSSEDVRKIILSKIYESNF